jgi:LuxR family maltose regulon positive regulatory protein
LTGHRVTELGAGGVGHSRQRDDLKGGGPRRVTATGPAGDEPAHGAFRPLLSKVSPPRPHLEPVWRRVLIDSVRRRRTPLVLVSGPAGAGKTTFLSELAAAEERPHAWLQLDADDNDPVVLLLYLCLTLGRVAVVDPSLPDLLGSRSPPVRERVLPSLEASLAAAAPFLLVLDDAHRLVNEDCWQIVGFVLDRLPVGAQLAVGTRSDPPLPLGRLRAASAVTELRAAELAFDRSEAEELLVGRGLDVDVATLEALLAATEGWATGLALASSIGSGRPTEEWLPNLRGDASDIADYLAGEILSWQPEATQQFLVRTAILERLSPTLARIVTGRQDAQRLLDRLMRENVFVTAIDERGEWYRYSPLFAQFLTAELERREPSEKPRLHRRAAEWLQTHGDVPAAVRHWIAAGDVEAAAAAVTGSWTRYWERGQAETVRLMLECFSREQILSDAPLTLTAGWVFSALSDASEAEQWGVRASSARVDDAPSPDGAASLRSSQALLRAMLARDGVSAMRRDAELAAGLERESGSSWYPDAMEALGRARWLSGSTRQAVAPLQVAAREGRVFNWSAELAALGCLSLIASDAGEWPEAEEYAREAQDRLEELGVGVHRRILPALLARARVLAHIDDPRVDEVMGVVEDELEHMPPASWMSLLACVILGEICLGRGDLAAAGHWCAVAQGGLRRYPDAGILQERTQRLRFALDNMEWTEPLTPAERRVLELLPTMLALDEIAARLYVSKNTLKTHLRDLYRKLETNSRAETVNRARELGLLGPQ